MGIRLGNFYTVLARKTTKNCSIRLGFRFWGLGNGNERGVKAMGDEFQCEGGLKVYRRVCYLENFENMGHPLKHNIRTNGGFTL